MKSEIESLVNELVDMESEFKSDEAGLRSLITDLKLEKPNTHLDEDFRATLRAQLTHKRNIVSPFFTFNRYAYSLIASLLVIILVVPLTSYITLRSVSNGGEIIEQVKNLTSSLSPKQKIQDKGARAFGTLALLPKTVTAKKADTTAPMAMSAAAPAAGAALVAQDTATDTPPEPVVKEVKTYTYEGADLGLNKALGNVYRRGTGIDAGRNLVTLIEKSDFGLVSLASFPNMSVKDIELSQDTTVGYRVNVNFDQGVVTIMPDPAKWPQMDTVASTSTKTPTTASVIAIANEFLKDHKINFSIYGNPIVRKAVGDYTVVYPLMINGVPVYTEDARVYGMEIGVDATNARVTSLRNLTSQSYDAAQYDLSMDTQKVLNAIGSYANDDFDYNYTASSSDAQIKYGTPSKILMRTINTTDIGAKEELFVPALLFPQKGTQNPVVVPLVKNFLTE